MYYKEENFHCEDKQAVEWLPMTAVQLLSLEILKTRQKKTSEQPGEIL